jgi:hypothetical protein
MVLLKIDFFPDEFFPPREYGEKTVFDYSILLLNSLLLIERMEFRLNYRSIVSSMVVSSTVSLFPMLRGLPAHQDRSLPTCILQTI